MSVQMVDKIRSEMEQNKADQYVQEVGQYLLDHLKANPRDTEKIAADKTIKGSLAEMRKEAEKKKTGNTAMFTPREGFAIVLQYFGITGAPVNVPASVPEKKSVGFNVSLDDLLPEV